MRESRTFGKRKNEGNSLREVNIKYLILSEGTKTEPRYFSAIEQNKASLGISRIIKILPLERSYREDTWSNPKKILDRLLLNIEETEHNKISYSRLLNGMIDCLYCSEYLTKRKAKLKEIQQLLDRIYKNVLHVKPDDFVENKESVIKQVTKELRKEWPRICELIIKNIETALEEQAIPYSSEIDKLCLVIDRDPESFTNNQFDYVKKTCEGSNVKLFVSNPGFELWLLMHREDFADFKDVLEEKFETPPTKKCLEYITSLIKQKFSGYSKSKFKIQPFMQTIETAVQNESLLSENIDALKDNLGSNVGLLIKEIRDTSTP